MCSEKYPFELSAISPSYIIKIIPTDISSGNFLNFNILLKSLVKTFENVSASQVNSSTYQGLEPFQCELSAVFLA